MPSTISLDSLFDTRDSLKKYSQLERKDCAKRNIECPNNPPGEIEAIILAVIEHQDFNQSLSSFSGDIRLSTDVISKDKH